MKKLLTLIAIATLVGCESDEETLAKCTPVPSEMVEVLNGGFSNEGYAIAPNTVRAVKSNAFKSLYFIAGRATGPQLPPPGHIGVWASNSLQAGEGMILSVNWLATDYSVWPDGKETQAKISLSDHGKFESESCAEVLSKNT